MPNFRRYVWIGVLGLSLGAGCIAAVAAAQKTVSITSCETFRAWFASQPAAAIFSIGPRDDRNAPRPRAVDTILTYRWDTMHPADPAFKRMRFYTTAAGGGGCMAGYYDATARTALIFFVYGTATDLAIVRTTSVPGGLPSHAVPKATKRGAELGMSLARVREIEGPGKLYRGKGGAAVLFYDQGSGDSYGGTLYGHLAFLLIDGRVAAIDVGGGH